MKSITISTRTTETAAAAGTGTPAGQGAPVRPTEPAPTLHVPTAVLFDHDGNARFQDPTMNASFQVDAETWSQQLNTTLLQSPRYPITRQFAGSGTGDTSADWALQAADEVPSSNTTLYPDGTLDRYVLVPAIAFHFTRARDTPPQGTVRLDVTFTDQTREAHSSRYLVDPADNTSFKLLIPFSRESVSERFFDPAVMHNNIQVITPGAGGGAAQIDVNGAGDVSVAFARGLRISEKLIVVKGFLAAGYQCKLTTVGIGSSYLPMLKSGLFSASPTTWNLNSNWPSFKI